MMPTVFGYGVLGEAVGVGRPSLHHTYCDRIWCSMWSFKGWTSKFSSYLLW